MRAVQGGSQHAVPLLNNLVAPLSTETNHSAATGVRGIGCTQNDTNNLCFLGKNQENNRCSEANMQQTLWILCVARNNEVMFLLWVRLLCARRDSHVGVGGRHGLGGVRPDRRGLGHRFGIEVLHVGGVRACVRACVCFDVGRRRHRRNALTVEWEYTHHTRASQLDWDCAVARMLLLSLCANGRAKQQQQARTRWNGDGGRQTSVSAMLPICEILKN